MSSMRTPKSVEVEESLGSRQEPRTKIKNKIVPAVATIAGTATAVPPHVLSREVVKNGIGGVFGLEGAKLDSVLEIIENSSIDQRYSVFPTEYTIEPRPLAQINAEYQEKAIELGLQVADRALAQAGMAPTDVDLLVTVSCTGVMIPSVDAHIAQTMGFRPDVRRLPITELGCAAGAAGLSHTWQYLSAFPDRTALLISVEIPTLTFQRRDGSQANLISAVLFGDGAAGVVVTGREAPGPRILASECFLFPNSTAAMGFDLRDSGFHILLAKDVPEMIGAKIKGLVHGFLERHGLTQQDIKGWILHPGGARLLGNVEIALGLTKCQTQPSWDILGNVGNLSSATILFILQEWLEKRPLQPGDYAMAAAFGPGFSAEFLLLQWT